MPLHSHDAPNIYFQTARRMVTWAIQHEQADGSVWVVVLQRTFGTPSMRQEREGVGAPEDLPGC